MDNYMETTKVAHPTVIDKLSHDQLAELVAWGESESYKIIRLILEERELNEVKAILGAIDTMGVTEDATKKLSSYAGRLKRGQQVLSLPEQARLKLEDIRQNETREEPKGRTSKK